MSVVGFSVIANIFIKVTELLLLLLLLSERIKKIMGLKRQPDIIEKKRLQWYGHVKRMPEDRIPKLIMEWTPLERRKRGRPRKTWIEGVEVAMTTRNLQPDQWRNGEEWRLVSGRQRQLL